MRHANEQSASRLPLTAGLAILLALGTPAFASAQASPTAHQRHPTRQAGHRSHMTLRYATLPGVVPRPGHLARLVGDPDSGLGFYALPRQFRTSARARYDANVRHQPDDAIRYAIASEQGSSYYYGIGGEDGYRNSNHHAMFNPVDGYGTPFFAGYYGPAGDPDDDHGPFGKPYN